MIDNNKTNTFIKLARIFYGVALVAYGVLQIIFQDYRLVIVPQWPAWLHAGIIVNIIAVIFIVAGLCISGIIPLTGEQRQKICRVIALVFFLFLLICHVPHELVISPNSAFHLGVWANALKELAFCGGALVIARTFSTQTKKTQSFEWLGPLFFCTTMILFGVAHFYYAPFVSPLVPRWVGAPLFWTYAAGIALIVLGCCIALQVFTRTAARLLAGMLVIWILMVHIPHAFADPVVNQGNEVASAFDALLFCGIALAIGFDQRIQPASTNASY